MKRLVLLLPLLAACPVEEPPDQPPAPTPFVLPDWQPGNNPLDAEVRGYREVRAIVHLHTPWSHDACDGDPQPGGVPDEDCLQDLRDALCIDRIDVAFLSDHPGTADDTDLRTLAELRGDDEELPYGTHGVANRMTCPDGHQVLWLPGIESGEMMPLALQEHMPHAYGVEGPDGYQAVREGTHAVMWLAHTEGRSVEMMASKAPDGVEVYQLHANLDPGIRGDFLGLDPFGYLGEMGPFYFPESNGILDPPQPDLGFLSFVLPNEPSLRALEELGQDMRLGVSGGTDAHRNVFNVMQSDGERVDSYRRVLRWFNTRLRIEGPLTPDSAIAALRAGRSRVVMEVIGAPVGFDFVAEGPSSGTVEPGSEVAFEEGLTLAVQGPTLDPRSPAGQAAPEIETRLYRATPQRTLVDSWIDAERHQIALDGPGVYRVEVWIRPRHLAPYLGEVADLYAETAAPWIYSGAIFVR